MPTYQYHCLNKDCYHNQDNYEVVHKISEHPLKVCPICKQETLESTPVKNSNNIIFNGVGWFNKGGY